MKRQLTNPAEKFPIADRNAVRYRNGGFWCAGHLAWVPLERQSPKDLRYCEGCQVNIQQEYQRIADGQGKSLSSVYKPVSGPQHEAEDVATDKTEDMVGSENGTDHPIVAKPSESQQGLSKRDALAAEIAAWKDSGKTAREIAALLADRDICVSSRTVARRLAEARQLKREGI